MVPFKGLVMLLRGHDPLQQQVPHPSLPDLTPPRTLLTFLPAAQAGLPAQFCRQVINLAPHPITLVA